MVAISGRSREALIARDARLIAYEIVGADGAAEVGPAAFAPIIDKAVCANERFEPFGHAQR